MSKGTNSDEDKDLSKIVLDNLRSIEIYFDELLAYIQGNMEPGDIFDNGELDAWALDNGYVKARQNDNDKRD